MEGRDVPLIHAGGAARVLHVGRPPFCFRRRVGVVPFPFSMVSVVADAQHALRYSPSGGYLWDEVVPTVHGGDQLRSVGLILQRRDGSSRGEA